MNKAPKKQSVVGKTIKSSKNAPISVSNNYFESKVIWDSEVLKTIQTVAQGLTNLTELFRAQQVDVTALRIETSETPKIK